MFGYSLGEYVVVILVGVFDLVDVLMLVVVCGCVMQEMLQGVMFSVVFFVDVFVLLLLQGVIIVVYNVLGYCVVVGIVVDIDVFDMQLVFIIV